MPLKSLHFALLFAVGCVAHPQPAPQAGDAATEVGRLVSQLSWTSVGYDHYAHTLWARPEGEVAARLIAIGKPATPELVSSLLEPSKAVGAQLILCAIWYPDETSSDEVIRNGDTVSEIRYS